MCSNGSISMIFTKKFSTHDLYPDYLILFISFCKNFEFCWYLCPFSIQHLCTYFAANLKPRLNIQERYKKSHHLSILVYIRLICVCEWAISHTCNFLLQLHASSSSLLTPAYPLPLVVLFETLFKLEVLHYNADVGVHQSKPRPKCILNGLFPPLAHLSGVSQWWHLVLRNKVRLLVRGERVERI